MTTQPTNQIGIDSFEGVVTVTMPITSPPPGTTFNTLLPHWKELQDDHRVVARLNATDNNTLTVTIMSLDDSNRAPLGQTVWLIIQHIRDGLAALKVIAGPMPSTV